MKIIFIGTLVTHLIIYSLNSFASSNPPGSIPDVVGSGTLDRSFDTNSQRVEFNTVKNSSTVALRLGNSKTGSSLDRERFFAGWALTATAPVNKSEENTDLATLDGLANSFTLGLAYSQLKFPVRETYDLNNPVTQGLLDHICREMTQNYAIEHNTTHEEAGKKLKCEQGFDSSTVAKYAKGLLDEYENIFLDPDKSHSQWGFEIKIGREDFAYLDPVSFQEQSETEDTGSISFFYTMLPASSQSAYTFGLEYQQAFESAKSEVRCPANGGDAVTCASGAFAEPSDKNGELIFFEYRRRVAGKAMSVRLTHDNESDVNGLDIPVYLIQDNKESLNGGIRIGYRDDTDDVEFGVFVGSSFKLFN